MTDNRCHFHRDSQEGIQTRKCDHRRKARLRPPAGDVGQRREARRSRGVKNSVQYTVVIEKSPGNYASYSPDLSGCVATGITRQEAVREMRSAIAFHIESLIERGD